jgi:hypothetical protein
MTTTEQPSAADMLQAALMESADYDGTESAIRAGQSAVLDIVSALAYLWDEPNRQRFLRELIAEVDARSDDDLCGLPWLAALLEHAAHAFADAVDIRTQGRGHVDDRDSPESHSLWVHDAGSRGATR